MSDETDFETCFETNGRVQVQRLDVIESSRGKRRWTPEARAQIVAESLEPRANGSAVARRHGMFRSSCTHGDANCGGAQKR